MGIMGTDKNTPTRATQCTCGRWVEVHPEGWLYDHDNGSTGCPKNGSEVDPMEVVNMKWGYFVKLNRKAKPVTATALIDQLKVMVQDMEEV